MLEGFFRPDAIAVVGAARTPGKVGHFVFRNVLDSGFTGSVFPVNPSADEIDGHTCFPSVDALPGVPDLAVIVVPAPAVPDVVTECGVAGIRSVIVISAGFKEAGPEGGRLEREVVARAAEHGVRLLGPNCLGLIATASAVNASFAGSMPPPGGISFMSQSGALGTAILDWAVGEGVGLAHFVSLGNRADISEVDLMDAWADDSDSRVVVAYLESVADGARFVESASRLTRHKPLIVLKSGRSDAGARAVSSHTGSLAGSDVAYDAAFRRSGVIRTHTVQELFDLATTLSRQEIPTGDGVAIVTNAGGPAVLATDACERLGVVLASLENDTLESLRTQLPPAAALYNPIDILGDAGPDRYARTLESVYRDPNVRCVLVILTPQAMTDPAGCARALLAASADSRTTTVASFMGGEAIAEASRLLREGGIPCFAFPEQAVNTLRGLFDYRSHLDTSGRAGTVVAGDRGRAREFIDSAVNEGRTFVGGEDAARVVEAYGIEIPRGTIAPDLKTALSFASEIGYPVVVKIASPDILHKSDIGGIRVGIDGPDELAVAYDAILSRARAYAPDAQIDGVHVQAQVADAREAIVGVDRDAQFGPLVMFGLGGIYVEILRDVTFRLCPVDLEQAREMIASIKGYGLLRGARGQEPADIEAAARVIAGISSLVSDVPEIVEIDINPLMVRSQGSGAVAADVRIGIGG